MRHLTIGVLGLVLGLWAGAGQVAAQKPAQQANPQVPPGLAPLLKGTADDFIKQFDKDKKGYVAKKDLPPRMAGLFDRADTNQDGKLDHKEVAQLLDTLRRRYGVETPAAQPAVSKEEVERVVDQLLARMDTNKDGKISRQEAKGPLARNFDQYDTNKDGFLDKEELRRVARQFLTNQQRNPGGRPPGTTPAANEPDFDALDRNADGRLTRDELKGTPFYDHFDEIDTNKDGKIDRKEFEAYLRKQKK